MMSSNLSVSGGGEGKACDSPTPRAEYYRQEQLQNFHGGGVNEIEEVFSSESFGAKNGVIKSMENIRVEVDGGDGRSFDFNVEGNDVVYVAVGKQSEDTSMDAVMWALKFLSSQPSTASVCLIHVFPETKFIPTPLGKLPIGQVNPEQKENYMVKERAKRTEFLQKFIEICSSYQVRVDTILIESDMEAKSILDLIPILNIKKLVLGTTKSNARRMRSKKGNGAIDQILQNAPEFCEVRIICEGKEMYELTMDSLPPSPSQKAPDMNPKPLDQAQKQDSNDAVACGCFKM